MLDNIQYVYFLIFRYSPEVTYSPFDKKTSNPENSLTYEQMDEYLNNAREKYHDNQMMLTCLVGEMLFVNKFAQARTQK